MVGPMAVLIGYGLARSGASLMNELRTGIVSPVYQGFRVVGSRSSEIIEVVGALRSDEE